MAVPVECISDRSTGLINLSVISSISSIKERAPFVKSEPFTNDGSDLLDCLISEVPLSNKSLRGALRVVSV